jgi:hypothetical protein
MRTCVGLVVGLLACVGGLPALAQTQVNSVAIEDARVFLAQYAAQSYQQSVQFLDLYSDRAWVRAKIEGQDKAHVFDGRSYKRWVREALASGKVALDASQFREVTLERRGARLVIRAKRYSANRCYEDGGYLVGIERDGPRYVIVEERITTQPASRCVESVASAGQLSVRTASNMGVLPGGAVGVPGMPGMVMGSSTNVQVPMIVGGLPGTRQPPLSGVPVPPPGMSMPMPALPPQALPPTLTTEQQLAEAMRLAQLLSASTGAPIAGEGVSTARPVSAPLSDGAADVRTRTPAVVVSPGSVRPSSVVVTPQ